MVAFLKVAATLGWAVLASLALTVSGWAPPWLF